MRKLTLINNEVRQRAIDAVRDAPDGYEVILQQKKRTQAQNRRYWGNGVLAQVSEKATVNGKKYSAEVWHEQFKRMFIGIEELPDGSIVGKSSATLSTKEFSDFCSQVEAYASTELDVIFYDLQ